MHESLLNFRPIGGSLYMDCDGKTDPNLLNIYGYRSARPDKISEEDFETIQSKLGIRYVIDLRNYGEEYLDATGMKVLDNSSEKCTLKVVDVMGMEWNSRKDIMWKNVIRKSTPLQCTGDPPFIHYIITFTAFNYFCRFLRNQNITLCKRIQGCIIVLFCLLFGLKYHIRHLSRVAYGDCLLHLYKDIVDGSGVAIRTALEIIRSHGSESFLICCHAGKDRTGILSALLLSLFGHDKDTVANDYAMTATGLPPDHPELAMYSPNFREARRDVMLLLLEYIDQEYGSVRDYLVSIGVPLEHQLELKQNLTGTKILE